MKKLALIFPGQGSQYVGMGKDLWDKFQIAKDKFNEANESLGIDISSMCFRGPQEEIQLTHNQQPAILTVSIAILNIIKEEIDIRPTLVAGHSLGEYSALVASGALSFTDAVRLVRKRGESMQNTVPTGMGAMAAILGLEKEKVLAVCEDVSGEEIVSIANFNSPKQVVISGHREAVYRVMEIVGENGAKKVIELPVSAPFHCKLMEPASVMMSEELEKVEIRELQIPVVSNVDARLNRDRGRVKRLLVEQIYSPVRWEESVNNMINEGVELFIEIGPGKVLSNLIKRINKKITVFNIEDTISFEKFKNSGSWL